VLDQLVQRPAPWLSETAPEVSVAVSSRVRLARNLADCRFPGRAELAARREVLTRVFEAAAALPQLQPALAFEMTALDDVDRSILLERRLISRELYVCGAGSGVVIKTDESLSLMVNEEDHLRLQAVAPGLDLGRAWDLAAEADNALTSVLKLAFKPGLGFLTACPTNVGTGLRASVMLHLPGLVMDGLMEGVMNAAARLGFAIRGLLGEGSEATANLFQVSNQSTLGESEEAIIQRLERIIRQTCWHEENARLRLVRRHRNRLYDCVARAYGILREARLLSSREAIEHLSSLRLGVELGMFTEVTSTIVNNLVAAVQPGHMQKRAGRELTPPERDALRAQLVRDRLRDPRRGDTERTGICGKDATQEDPRDGKPG